MAKFYKVLNPAGTLIGIRKSNSDRGYTHAVISTGANGESGVQAYCGRRDLAEKQLAHWNQYQDKYRTVYNDDGTARRELVCKLYWHFEIVDVIEIDSAEHRRCKKELAA